MNREILFRGKMADGDWFYGSLVRELSTGKTYILDAGRISETTTVHDLGFEVIEKTVGQFTGLLDKNGVKIFEGDKVEDAYILCDRQPTQVEEWGDFCAGYFLKKERFIASCELDMDNPTLTSSYERQLPDCFDIEDDGGKEMLEAVGLTVIGNVHDAPESEVKK